MVCFSFNMKVFVCVIIRIVINGGLMVSYIAKLPYWHIAKFVGFGNRFSCFYQFCSISI